MQIWKVANISVFIRRKLAEDLTLKHLLLIEICALKKSEKFVYKHSEIKEYFKD